MVKSKCSPNLIENLWEEKINKKMKTWKMFEGYEYFAEFYKIKKTTIVLV